MSRRIIEEWIVRITNVGFFRCSLWSVRGDDAFKRDKLETRQLTKTEISCCSVAVQFSSQFVIFAFHPNPFRVEVSGVSEFSFIKFVITFVLVNFCYRWKGEIKINWSQGKKEKKDRTLREGHQAAPTRPRAFRVTWSERKSEKKSAIFKKQRTHANSVFI